MNTRQQSRIDEYIGNRRDENEGTFFERDCNLQVKFDFFFQ